MRLTLFSRLSKKACWLLVTDMSSSNEISGDTFWPVVRQHYSAILVDIVRFKTYKSFMIATWLSMTSWQVHTFGHITLCNLCPESITWRWFWRLSIGKGFTLYSTCPFRTLALALANTLLVSHHSQKGCECLMNSCLRWFFMSALFRITHVT